MMFWAIYICFWGIFQQLMIAYSEFFAVVSTRRNTSHHDFWIHTICDFSNICATLLAYKFPKLWEGMNVWWFTMFCTYHFFTAYFEQYDFF